jgi:hypothetical protein
MSHETIWRCRACKAPLGVVSGDGALAIEGQRATIGRDGSTQVVCAGCGAVREWRAAPRGGAHAAWPSSTDGGWPAASARG